MIAFVTIATLLTVLVVIWLVRPLLRPNHAVGASSQRLNATIYRDQLEALERDLSRGTIGLADYEATRDEVQLRLLDDIVEPEPVCERSSVSFWTATRTAAAIALLFPLGAVGFYLWLGTPGLINPLSAQQQLQEQTAQMIEALEKRLQAHPGEVRGWAMLGRSYKVTGRLSEAEQAYLKAGDLLSSNPDVMVDFADLLAARASGNIEGKPLDLINSALKLDPRHPEGLMVAGVAAYRRNQYTAALGYWEQLLAILEPGSQDAQRLEADIADAKSKSGTASAGNTVVSGSSDPSRSSSPDSMLPPVDAANANGMTQEKINQMVERLATRLKTNPDDPVGWARLARAYKVQGRLAEAEEAYVKAGKIVDTDPDLLAQYADLLAMRADNKIEGRPLALVNRALRINPNHSTALMMAGSAALQRKDFKQAIANWEKALISLEPGSQEEALVKAELADARHKLATSQSKR